MFPFKKKNPKDTDGTKSESVAKKSIKTMDTVVTGMILGGIIASLYGVKKLMDKNTKTDNTENHDEHHS